MNNIEILNICGIFSTLSAMASTREAETASRRYGKYDKK